MKNKKLFAILTLVCFMFTLMPVAAFAATTYAEVDEDSAYVTLASGTASATLTITNATTESYYVYANAYGAFSKAFGFQPVTVAGATAESPKTGDVTVNFNREGTYELHVVPATAGIVNQSTLTNAEKVALLEDKSGVVMLDKTVVVKPETNEYVLEVVDVDFDGIGDWTPAVVDNPATEENEAALDKIELGANSGYAEAEVTVLLKSAISGNAVVGATVDVSTNSYAVDVDKAEVKTNAAGLAKFTVASSIAGNFKVYVEYGAKTDLTIDIVSGALTPANIVKISEKAAPVALDSAVDKTVYFNITDANGNAVAKTHSDYTADFAYRVVVSEKPVGSDIIDDNIKLSLTSKGWTLTGEDLDEEGDYTFKVVLENGSYATAKVTAKEFQTPVALKLAYPAPAVELGGKIAVDELVFVDANGVEESAFGKVTLSANGHAISTFVEKEGTNYGVITTESDEKYVGATIKVMAVSEKYNLVDTVELVVANEAAAVKYLSTNADVAVNNTLVANIVDVDGNKTSVNTTDAYATQFIVLDKPANAKVAISEKSPLDPATGQFKVSFTASAAGEYKVQTIVRSTDEKGVVKYYSGIETITVGDKGTFEDIVVVSIGATKMIVNDEVVELDVAPFIENSRTMLQYNVLYVFGIDVQWVKETNSVVAEGNGIKVVMNLGSKVATVNGEEVTLDVAPYAVNGRTVVPVGFITGTFGIGNDIIKAADGSVADILFTK